MAGEPFELVDGDWDSLEGRVLIYSPPSWALVDGESPEIKGYRASVFFDDFLQFGLSQKDVARYKADVSCVMHTVQGKEIAAPAYLWQRFSRTEEYDIFAMAADLPVRFDIVRIGPYALAKEADTALDAAAGLYFSHYREQFVRRALAADMEDAFPDKRLDLREEFYMRYVVPLQDIRDKSGTAEQARAIMEKTSEEPYAPLLSDLSAYILHTPKIEDGIVGKYVDTMIAVKLGEFEVAAILRKEIPQAAGQGTQP